MDNTLFYIKCSGCGVQQTKPGLCWDNDKCSKCFNKESTQDIVKNYDKRKPKNL